MIQTIAGIWLFSFLFKAPQLFTYRLTVNETSGARVCDNLNTGTTSWHVYEYMQVAQHFVIPVVIAVVLYGKICRLLWRVDATAHANRNSERSKVQRRQAEELDKRKRAVKMMITCVTTFFLCYAPKAVFDFIAVAL